MTFAQAICCIVLPELDHVDLERMYTWERTSKLAMANISSGCQSSLQVPNSIVIKLWVDASVDKGGGKSSIQKFPQEEQVKEKKTVESEAKLPCTLTR